MSNNEGIPCDDLESLGMSLGKRLGRLEISGVEVVEQLLTLTDKVEVIEKAAIEENVNREEEKDEMKIVIGKLDDLERKLKVIQDEHNDENLDLKTKLLKLREDHTDLKEKFLSLVLNCQVYEDKIKIIENKNSELMEAVINLEKDKEMLMASLATNSSQISASDVPLTLTSSVSPQSSSSSLANSPLYSQPPPPILRASLPTPPIVQPVMIPPQYMPVYPTLPPQYVHNPYTQAFPYQDWSEQE